MHTTKINVTLALNLVHDGLHCAECETHVVVETVMRSLRETYDVEEPIELQKPLPDPFTYTWDGVPIYLTKITEVEV